MNEINVTRNLPSVSICFPAYNEEATIGSVLEEAHELLSKSGLDYEIIVCNDGSVDRTGSIIDEIVAPRPNMRVIHHSRNRGIRETFEHLYSQSTKEFIFLNSTDRQWDTRILFEILPMAHEWDIVIASRKQKYYSATRQLISWCFNAVPRALFGVRTYDAGAVKLVRREIILKFPLVSQSPFSEAERLIRAARAGHRITEHPVSITARREGRARGVSFKSVIAAAKDVWRVWRDLRKEPAQNGLPYN